MHCSVCDCSANTVGMAAQSNRESLLAQHDRPAAWETLCSVLITGLLRLP